MRKLKKDLLPGVLGLFLMATQAFAKDRGADTLVVRGVVKTKNKQPIAAATVFLKNAGVRVRSDGQGGFRMLPLRTNLLQAPTLYFSAAGYEDAEGEIDLKHIKDLKTKELNIGVVMLEKAVAEEKEYTSFSQWLFSKARAAVRNIVK